MEETIDGIITLVDEAQETLLSFEDWMHGDNGIECSQAIRKLIDAITELELIKKEL